MATTAESFDLDSIPQIRLRRGLERRLERLAAAAYPHEGCGVLIGTVGGGAVRVERVTAARNLNRERPEDRYELDPGDFVAADRAARAEGLEIVGFWHSHPDHQAVPSRTDLEAAWPGYSYVIVTSRATAAGPVRCWRLGSSGFYEQTITEEIST